MILSGEKPEFLVYIRQSAPIGMVETEEDELNKTLICNLETSQKKNEKVRECIDEWQEIAEFYANRLVSFNERKWGQHSNDCTGAFYKPIKEGRYSDCNLFANDAQQAYEKVSASFDSWRSNGKSKKSPKGQFGEGNYMILNPGNFDIVENDVGFGVKWDYQPYSDEVWFHINGGSYQHEILDRIVNGDPDFDNGTAEFRLSETGRLDFHLHYTEPIELYKRDECNTAVGVDVGERAVYAVAAINRKGLLDQEIQRGDEFEKRRDELKEKRDAAQRKKKKYKLSDERHRYTEQMANVYASQILDFAVRYEPCVLCLENLTGLRKQVKDPNHDWPYDLIQKKIALESRERRIPVEFVDAKGTSKTCRKCKSTDTERSGHYLKCLNCGYNPHSDFNAAVNIAEKYLT